MSLGRRAFAFRRISAAPRGDSSYPTSKDWVSPSFFNRRTSCLNGSVSLPTRFASFDAATLGCRPINRSVLHVHGAFARASHPSSRRTNPATSSSLSEASSAPGTRSPSPPWCSSTRNTWSFARSGLSRTPCMYSSSAARPSNPASLASASVMLPTGTTSTRSTSSTPRGWQR